ncbi:hypothetical protein GCM10022384_18730 [Streptomyces marokkonensis]|uniref:Uncharacterized protein n=1 Tax=Streptomyces marokkonensis TaxID=324855 RepID=A0ABP7PL79_9ACTN
MPSDAATRTDAIPPEVLAVLVLALPGLKKLTDDQVRGADCVWCRASLTADMAVDFGEQTSPAPWSTSRIGMRWYPRACPACTGQVAHRGLLDHAPGCEDCKREPEPSEANPCPINRALYQLVKDGRR